MSVPTNRVFNEAAGGTQTTVDTFVPKSSIVGYAVDHPAGTTTTYTVEGSNSPDSEIAAATDKWLTYDAVTIPAKSSAEYFGVRLTQFPFRRCRMKAVTSAGSGTIVIDVTVKDL